MASNKGFQLWSTLLTTKLDLVHQRGATPPPPAGFVVNEMSVWFWLFPYWFRFLRPVDPVLL